jgi:hypothetical protein
MENLIKLHKAQLASDRMSCHSATANQVRLVLHTAAFWLMHGVRAAIPQTDPLAKAEFTTTRAPDQDRCARDRAHRAHPHPTADQLSGGSAVPRRRIRPDALRTMRCGAKSPGAPGRSTPNVLHSESHHTDPTRPADPARAHRIHVQNKPESCIIRAKDGRKAWSVEHSGFLGPRHSDFSNGRWRAACPIRLTRADGLIDPCIRPAPPSRRLDRAGCTEGKENE